MDILTHLQELRDERGWTNYQLAIHSGLMELNHMEKLYTRKEAANILGISLYTLDTARTEGLISYVQYVKNGSVYFTERNLSEYIARNTRRARPKRS